MMAANQPIGRLLRSEDFKRLLATPPKARSLHFAVHHLPQGPSAPARRRPDPAADGRDAGARVGEHSSQTSANPEAPGLSALSAPSCAVQPLKAVAGPLVEDRLSTSDSCSKQPVVDKTFPSQALQVSPGHASAKSDTVKGTWLGCVVPKRHARRSVTRNLLRRQIRQVALDMEPPLQAGLWLVRMRVGFDRKTYPSAASQALKEASRKELIHLLLNSRAAVDGRRTPRGEGGRGSR